jgi:hypothetical protein
MKGVKDSLITFSAVGAAGLLAYYSLSNPSTIDHPKALQKRSFDSILDSGNDSQFYSDFCLDDFSQCHSEPWDDVSMFQDDGSDDEDDYDDDDPNGLLRSRRKKKNKNKGNASNAGAQSNVDKGAEAAEWLKTSSGQEMLKKKETALSKQLDNIHRSNPVADLAQLNEDAPRIPLGSYQFSATTSDVISELRTRESGSANCEMNASQRLNSAHIFSIFPEDIMFDSTTNQDELYNAYINFSNSLNQFVIGGASNNVGFYSYNNIVTLSEYSSDWTQKLGWNRLNVPAKKNRQGSFNLGAAMPSLSKLSGNIWKKVQKIVKRATDTTPQSTSCQIFLFMHNVPLEYKSLAQGGFSLPDNLLARCNIIPVTIGSSATAGAFQNVAAHWDDGIYQKYTVVEPALRGYLNTNVNEFSANTNFIANSFSTYSCLSENRLGCMIKKGAWYPPIEEFRMISTTEEPAFTTAATTSEGTSTTSWTTTGGTTTEAGETTEPMEVAKHCCGKNGGSGLDGVPYDINSQQCVDNGSDGFSTEDLF